MIEIIQTIVFMSALYFSIAYLIRLIEAIIKRSDTSGLADFLAVISWGLLYYLTLKN